LRYAAEVRKLADLNIEPEAVSKPELQLALQLIDQISADGYDPTEYKDEEKARVLAAIDAKIAGQEIVSTEPTQAASTSGQVIDLVDALRASLSGKGGSKAAAAPASSKAPATKKSATVKSITSAKTAATRKAPRRAAAPAEEAEAPAPARSRARK